MSKKLDLVGKKYGRLLVISESPHSKNQPTRWLCKCDCGNETVVFGVNIKRGLTQSCGCFNKERIRSIFTTHGATAGGRETPEYKAWCHIKDRCYNEKNKQFKDWGGRGIKMCDRWKDSFDNFLSDMGLKPSKKHSIDRFPNNDGDYEPSNCRWGTSKEQNGSRRNNVIIEYNGECLVQRDWSKRLGVCEHTINRYINKGKSIGDIIEHFKDRKTKV